MSQLIIQPSKFPLPKVAEHVVLFFSLQHLFQFREITGGSKIKSFGPAKRFDFVYEDKPVTALGGMIGAPHTVMNVEHAIHAGGRNFLSFGSAGWIGDEPRPIGDLVSPEIGLDTTGMTQDYEGNSSLSRFDPLPRIPRCNKVVTVNSVYRLTHERLDSYRHQQVDLIDMESAPLNYIVPKMGGSYRALFIISDRVEQNYQWSHGFDSINLNQGMKQAMKMIPSLLFCY